MLNTIKKLKNLGFSDNDIRETETIDFDHVFYVDGQEESCHHTGLEIYDQEDGTFWNVYIDSNDAFHFGR